jgi:DNA segregation ATPase FtsK/SpoIIIE-like protein
VIVNQRDIVDGLPLQGHMLVVGGSGSGKTNVLMGQIIRRLKDGQTLHVIDVKDEIGPIFERTLNVNIVPVERARAKFVELLTEASSRRQLFREASAAYERPVRDFGEYFRVTGVRLPVVTLIIEELVVLMDEVPQADLVKTLVVCRSAGIFIIALSQYLKADILDRKGSINFSTRVFLGKYDRIACGILFGNLERDEVQMLQEFLGPPGKGAVEEGGELTTRTFQRITDDYLIPFMKG